MHIHKVLGRVAILSSINLHLPTRRKPIKGIGHSEPLKRKIKKPRK